MEIVVGSKNIPKRQAVANAFRKLYPGDYIDVQGAAANSEVSAHPVSASESLEGAKRRVKHARELKPEADFYVGIEGGLLEVDNTVWELGWVAVENSKGQVFTGVSAGIEVRGKVLEAIRGGRELNDVLREDFDIENAGGTNGFYGIATDDVITRQEGYEQAIIFALAPFKHPQYFE
jgi:inosine/xanthosine triphosphatase